MRLRISFSEMPCWDEVRPEEASICLRAGTEGSGPGKSGETFDLGPVREASERAPSDYVEKLFDEYANKFDSHLVKVLNYTRTGEAGGPTAAVPRSRQREMDRPRPGLRHGIVRVSR